MRNLAMKTGLVGFALTLGACSANPEDPSENVARVEEKIINGDEVVRDDLIQLGNGTGTLLSRSWVLTCEHCIGGTALEDFTFTQASTGETRRGVEKHDHPTMDVALVRVDEPFPVAGTTYDVNRLWPGSTQDLVGEQGDCYGFGFDTYYDWLGPLRHGVMPLSSAGSADFYRIDPNSEGQIIWMGDSGGPCFVDRDGESYLTGVHVLAWHNESEQRVLYSWDASAAAFDDWAMERAKRMTADLRFTTTWGTGYCAEVTVTNNGPIGVPSWEVAFDTHDSQIYTAWNADFSNEGSAYTAESLEWNGNLAAGGSQTFGFCANKAGGSWEPQVLAASHTPRLGDANGDNAITTADSDVIAAEYAGLPADPFYARAADTNCNGTIDIVDALLVGQYLQGIIGEFPCGT